MLKESYDKIQTHLKLLNEDIDKFNLSYDFGLIAAQMEALEGRSEVMSGGLLSPEREELSTRMRFKRPKLSDEELPPAPDLPPLAEIKGQLDSPDRTHLSTWGLLPVIAGLNYYSRSRLAHRETAINPPRHGGPQCKKPSDSWPR